MLPLPKVYAAHLSEAEDGILAAVYGPDADEAGLLYEWLVDAFQGLAICNLLLDYDVGKFRADLVYAAGARRQFLQLCVRDGARPLHAAIGRTDALVCAVAARDHVLAADLVRLGPTDWIPDGEYEDDFCYQAYLSHVVAPAFAARLPPPSDLVKRHRDALEGASSARQDILDALETNSPDAFRAAFDALLVERADWAEEYYEARRDQPLFLAARHVFVEGLALLAIADARGWPMRDTYSFCPAPARLAPVANPPEDLFIDVVPFIRESRLKRGLTS